MPEEYNYEDDVRREITSLKSDMLEMDSTMDRTAVIRNMITYKLSDIVTAMEIDANTESSKVIEAKMGIINQLAQQANDMDKQAINRVNMKMKLQSLEDVSTDYSKIIAEFLQKLNKNQVVTCPSPDDVDIDNCDDELEAIFEDSDLIIADTELREDPTDYS